jgi:hypothetical protein
MANWVRKMLQNAHSDARFFRLADPLAWLTLKALG